MNSRKLELFGKAAANQFYKSAAPSATFSALPARDEGIEVGSGDFNGGSRSSGDFGTATAPALAPAAAPAAPPPNAVPTSTNPFNNYLQPFLQPIQQMMGGSMDMSKLGPYMGLLAPIFKGIGGVAGLPGVAGMLNMLRGGKEMGMLGRGMFEGHDTRDPDAALRQQYAQQNRQQYPQPANTVRVDPTTGKPPEQHPAFKPIPSFQPPAPNAPAQQPSAPVPPPTKPPAPTPVKLPNVPGIPTPPKPAANPPATQPASPS